MRSKDRARYEQGLAQIARGARLCAAICEQTGSPGGQEDFILLAGWVSGELQRSLADKRPDKQPLSAVYRAQGDAD